MVLMKNGFGNIQFLLFLMYMELNLVGSLLKFGVDWKLMLLIEYCGVLMLLIDMVIFFVCWLVQVGWVVIEIFGIVVVFIFILYKVLQVKLF